MCLPRVQRYNAPPMCYFSNIWLVRTHTQRQMIFIVEECSHHNHIYKPTHTIQPVFIAPGYKYSFLICATVHIRSRHMVTCLNPTSIGLPNFDLACIRFSYVFLAYSPLRMNIQVGKNERSYLFFSGVCWYWVDIYWLKSWLVLAWWLLDRLVPSVITIHSRKEEGGRFHPLFDWRKSWNLVRVGEAYF